MSYHIGLPFYTSEEETIYVEAIAQRMLKTIPEMLLNSIHRSIINACESQQTNRDDRGIVFLRYTLAKTEFTMKVFVIETEEDDDDDDDDDKHKYFVSGTIRSGKFTISDEQFDVALPASVAHALEDEFEINRIVDMELISGLKFTKLEINAFGEQTYLRAKPVEDLVLLEEFMKDLRIENSEEKI